MRSQPIKLWGIFCASEQTDDKNVTIDIVWMTRIFNKKPSVGHGLANTFGYFAKTHIQFTVTAKSYGKQNRQSQRTNGTARQNATIMQRIAANKVLIKKGLIVNNGVVTLDEKHQIIDSFSDDCQTESAGTKFYNGLKTPDT